MPVTVEIPNVGNLEFSDGMSQDEMSSAVENYLTQKGGEQKNAQSQPQANSDRNAERGAVQQVNAPSQSGPQPSQEPTDGNQQVPQRDINASEPQALQLQENVTTPSSSKGGEIVEKDAKTESQRTQEWQENGQGIRGQSDAGKQAQISKEGNVPSVASQLLGTISSPFGYIGEEGWKGIAGIADTFGARKFRDYALQNSANSVEDWAKSIGGEPQKEGVGKTIGQVGAFVAEAPLMLTAAGIPTFLAQGYGSMKEDLKSKYMSEGMTEDAAKDKSTVHAAMNTAAAIPAYMLGGKVAGKVADKMIADSAPALVKLAGRFGLNGVMNMVANAVTQGVGAAIEGQDPIEAAKQISPSSVIQAFTFAGHDSVKWLNEEIGQAQKLREAPDFLLKVAISKGGDKQGRMQAELDRRDKEAQVKGAKSVGLDATAEELAKGGPEKPKLKAAAFKPEGSDEIHEADNHQNAIDLALEKGTIDEEKHGQYTDKDLKAKLDAGEISSKEYNEDSAARRNGDEFGFTTTDGRFVGREEAYKIAKESGQSLVERQKDHEFPTEDGAKLHSHETKLTDYPEVEVSKEPPKKPTLMQSIKDAWTHTAEVLDGTTIPNLTRAGVKLSATKHAHAYRALGAEVDSLIAQVFPEKYKNEESIERVMDIINKDNVLGGYDQLKSHFDEMNARLQELQTAADEGKGQRGDKQEIKDLKLNIEDQKKDMLAVSDAHDLAKYQSDVEAAKGTDVEQDINRWKEVIHPKMDELFQKLNGQEKLLNTERGRNFGVRVNLLPKEQAERISEYLDKDKDPEPMVSVGYRNPDIKEDRLAKRASLTSQYSSDVRMILHNSFADRLNEVSKLDLYNDLIDKKVATFADKSGPPKSINGKPVKRMPIDYPVKNESTGKVTMQERSLYVRSDLYPEIKQILAIDKDSDSHKGILNSITKMQLVGFADGITHLKNVSTVLNNALGRETLGKDILSKVPILNLVKTISETRKVIDEIDTKSPAVLKEIADIAKTSGMRPYYKTERLQRILSPLHDTLHKVDTAARVIMGRRWDNLVERGIVKPSEEGKIDFINQIGEYNSRLMGRWEAQLKSYGASPFIVAGRAMNRAAKRLIAGDPGFSKEQAASNKAWRQSRALQVGSLVAAGTAPAIINMMTTGSMFGRAGTPIGAIDLGPQYDTKDGKRRTIDLFQILSMRRGLRATGLDALINGLKNGDSAQNIQTNMMNDAVTTAMHPFIGPAVGMIGEVLTGKRIDMRSGYTGTYTSRKIGGAMQYVENFRTALKQQNELLYNIGFGKAIEKGMELANIPEPAEENESATLRDLGVSAAESKIPYSAVRVPVEQLTKAAWTVGSTALGAIGGKLAVSPALKLSSQLGEKQQYSPEQDVRYAARKKIIDAVIAGDMTKARDLYDQGVKQAILTSSDKNILQRRIAQPDLLIQRVSRLKTVEDALQVFRVATPEEQDNILETVTKKFAGSSALRTPDGELTQQGQKLLKEFQRVARPGTKLYKEIHSQ